MQQGETIMGFNIGLEAVNYNVKSKFSTELIDLFQEVIDVRKSLKEKSTSLSQIVSDITKYFLQVTAPKMTKCIQQHTGIPVSKLFVSKSFSTMYACTVDFGGDKGFNMYTTIQQYSGLELSEMDKEYIASLKQKPLTPEDLAKLTKSFDARTGKMNISKIAGKNISFILYFDYCSAFLAKETGHKDCEYMEASEIAAIVLHEVGHMLTLFEHASDLYFKAEFFNNTMVNYIKNTDNKVDVIRFGLSFLEKQFPDKKKAVDALSAKVDEHVRNTKDDARLPTFLSLLYIAVASILTLLAILLILPFRLLWGLLSPMTFNIEDAKKLSDYAFLKKQYKYCEQIADEFVSRHGLSGPLGSGLQKIFDSCQVAGLTIINKNSSLAWHAAKVPYILNTLFYGDLTSGGGLYDREADRIHRAMIDLIGVFKDSTLPPEAIKFYTDDYERCKEVIESYNRKRKFTEVMYAANEFINYLLETPIDSLFTGRFLREYNNLHNKAEQLIANPMFYHSAKLRQLISTMKG
jgi:hypothetical protein